MESSGITGTSDINITDAKVLYVYIFILSNSPQRLNLCMFILLDIKANIVQFEGEEMREDDECMITVGEQMGVHGLVVDCGG